jgi:hypothetical protein
MTPLGSFLLDISPSLLDILPHLDAVGIPLDTPPTDLLELDTDDTTIWNLFQDVPTMKLAQVALATEGIRKARKKWLADKDAPLNPKLLQGLQKAKIDRWVRSMITRGEAMNVQGECLSLDCLAPTKRINDGCSLIDRAASSSAHPVSARL